MVFYDGVIFLNSSTIALGDFSNVRVVEYVLGNRDVQTGRRCHGHGGDVVTVATKSSLQTGSISRCVNGPACINLPGNYFTQSNPQLTLIWTIIIHQEKERYRIIKVVYTVISPGTSKDIKVSGKDFLKIRRMIHFQKCLEYEGVVLLYHF
jgi:hypothetical protein